MGTMKQHQKPCNGRNDRSADPKQGKGEPRPAGKLGFGSHSRLQTFLKTEARRGRRVAGQRTIERLVPELGYWVFWLVVHRFPPFRSIISCLSILRAV